ncbi:MULTISPECIES: NaeI family type II restriction endonuclease [Kitasatospora]|uniref:Putative type II restriction enzyme n=1 Tax=Kitasatospora setae (strain ATCC 33774 / DSM 43861 / JCM 3304 / KCC A-0304 / NBRC 14216 / KM-6054) TaxID=452652 RepID=E4N3S8_KITSK|nr:MULTISPECIES: NaeI family type II restriction endonuclease [Kitasatospora]BAJ31559.1 putative type II restriction enzyme [Kitasatospora setae KM-6054]
MHGESGTAALPGLEALLRSGEDSELEKVARHLLRSDPKGEVFAGVLRSTIDQLLDGERTGRFDWKTLHKTEKTHAGTLVEINLQRAFKFASHADDSDIHMDYLIEGVEVDCKFSQRPYGWMIPPEALGEVCLVVWADDHRSEWSAGLFRAHPDSLTETKGKTRKGNRDGKFSLTKEHRHLVRWLWESAPLRKNLLLHLDVRTRQRIMDAGPSGQAKVNELFRLVHDTKVDREVIRTLARQYDYMARIREGRNRARTVLRDEGIIILGKDAKHRAIALDLGGAVPERGEFVAHRVRRAEPGDAGRPAAVIEGAAWVIALPGEQAAPAAPQLPTTRNEKAAAD